MADDQIFFSEELYRGWLTLLLVQARLNGEDVRWPLVEHPSGSAVLPYDPQRKVAITITQARLPVMHLGNSHLREAVGGVAEDETPEDTAKRECLEETGVRLRNVIHVGHVWMTPATSTERVHLFLGEYNPGDRVSAGGGAGGENEKIDVREESLADLLRAIQGGELVDAKLFMLVQALHERQPDLFS